ncbi:MAG: heparinase II/III family protein [Planctomycetota bacterium]|nr:heparinase II/III family protein [Planctomycetota bacterium]
MHPHLLLTADAVPGLRSLADVRDGIDRHPHAAALWNEILVSATADLDAPPLTPLSQVPNRSPAQTAAGNRDYTIVHASGQRVLRSALAALVTGEARFRETAMRQVAALLDDKLWPIWRDLAHPQYPADLRTGALCRDLGLAYDWLAHDLSPTDRAAFAAGLDRRGLQPILESRKLGAWWSKVHPHDMNNWHACVVGGAGICAMALGPDHPQSREIIDFSLEVMAACLTIYGPEGEYNESIGYSAATFLPAAYFDVLRHHTSGRDNRLAQWPFPQTCLWQLHFILPPGRFAAFGDTHDDRPVQVSHYPTLADAVRADPVQSGLLQWVYLTYGTGEAARALDGRNVLTEFLSFNPDIAPVSPAAARLPTGRAFPAHGGCISSRTDWKPDACELVVYGKAGHGSEIHGNHDAGQVCLDSRGEKLIIDCGIPSLYPEDFFGPNRHRYYCAGVVGHNVLMFNRRETAVGITRAARIVSSSFASPDAPRPLASGAWTLDLTGVYDDVTHVQRSVVHLGPVVAVLDVAELLDEQEISLRWHTAVRPDLRVSSTGSRGDADETPCDFTLLTPAARLVARIHTDLLPFKFAARAHAYAPPFDRDRLGNLLVQTRENYVEAIGRGRSCRLLTLFAVNSSEAPAPVWQSGVDKASHPGDPSAAIASIVIDGQRFEVSVTQLALAVTAPAMNAICEARFIVRLGSD